MKIDSSILYFIEVGNGKWDAFRPRRDKGRDMLRRLQAMEAAESGRSNGGRGEDEESFSLVDRRAQRHEPQGLGQHGMVFEYYASQPRKYYIGTWWPQGQKKILRLDGRRERGMAPEEGSSGGMEITGGMDGREESQGRSSEEAEVQETYCEGKEPEIRLPELPFDLARPEISHFSGQWEAGDSRGIHFQFYVEYRDRVRIPQARRYLEDGRGRPFSGWLEPTRSSAALDYVRKDRTRIGERIEIGKPGGGSGGNGTLSEMFSFLQNGGSVQECSTRWPFLYSKNVNAVAKWGAQFDRPRNPKNEVECIIYYGKTGTGKSRKAFEENQMAYRKKPGKWWDGYKGEDTVIFDEYRPPFQDDYKTSGDTQEMSLVELLRVLDRYPLQVEYKGGSCQCRATKFIFTTNHNPLDWFRGNNQVPALRRRIRTIIEFREKNGVFTQIHRDWYWNRIRNETIEEIKDDESEEEVEVKEQVKLEELKEEVKKEEIILD